MSIVTRAMNMITKPKEEWLVVAAEPASVGGLFTGYAIILAAIPVIASVLFVGLLGIGGLGAMGGAGLSLGMGFVATMAIVGYVISLIVLYVMSLIVKAVSPSFNGNSDMVQATKLMTYASTPAWLVGAISWIPVLGWLLGIAAVVYVVYLIYLGLTPVLGVPQEKVAGFTVVVVLIYIVLQFVLSAIIAGAVVSSFMGAGMMAGAMAS